MIKLKHKFERQVQDMNINDIVERYPIDVMEHAERVMNLVRPFGKDYMMVALLHDILEDTKVTYEDLSNTLLPYNIINNKDVAKVINVLTLNKIISMTASGTFET